MTESEALNWLAEPHLDGYDRKGQPIYLPPTNSATWLSPAPVVGAACSDSPDVPLFRDHITPDQLGRSFERPDLVIWGKVMEGRHYRVRSFLGSDWRFDEIARPVRETPEYQFHGRQVVDFTHQLLLVVHRIEDFLRSLHPHLSRQAVADFWQSWQVYEFIATFCGRELVKAPEADKIAGGREIVEASESAREHVGKELVVYCRSLLTDPSMLGTGGRRKPGPKPRNEEHAKLAAIVAQAKGDWKSQAELRKICRRANQQKIFVPMRWKPVTTWSGMLEKDRERVVKVIEARLRRWERKAP